MSGRAEDADRGTRRQGPFAADVRRGHLCVADRRCQSGAVLRGRRAEPGAEGEPAADESWHQREGERMSAGAVWSQGYVTDVSYTNSFFRELSPAWLNHAVTAAGAHPRPLEDGFNHIDLGCGLGQSSNVLAACFPR